MRIISTLCEMQQQSDSWRRDGRQIALVPTMGYLHEGHLSLIRTVRSMADVVVVSIFVNPAQFGPNEDFERYPRDMERDLLLSGKAGADVIFAPEVKEMYPEGYQTYVEVTRVTASLCGKSRPIHFRGVATVVTKLFNSVKPHMAIFGEKDYQQLVTIRRMAADLSMDVKVLGHPIVREADNLAMSSRNVFLNSEQRRKALRLSRAIGEAQSLVDRGELRGGVILDRVREVLDPDGEVRIDYAQLCHPETLEDVDRVDGAALLALAVHVGKTRLIDNRILNARP